MAAGLVTVQIAVSLFYLDYHGKSSWEARKDFMRDYHRNLQGKIKQALSDHQLDESYSRAHQENTSNLIASLSEASGLTQEPQRYSSDQMAQVGAVQQYLAQASSSEQGTNWSPEMTEVESSSNELASLPAKPFSGFAQSGLTSSLSGFNPFEKSDYPDPVAKRSQWFVGGSVAFDSWVDHPHYASLVQKESFHFHKNLDKSSARSITYLPTTGFAVGVQGGLQLGRNFEVETGIHYHRWTGVSTTVVENVFRNEITHTEWVEVNGGSDPSSDPTSSYSPRKSTQTLYSQRDDTVRTEFSQSFVEIPLILRYGFGNGNWKLYFSTGLSANLVNRHKLNLYSHDQERSMNKTVVSPIGQVNALLGANLDYELSPGVKLRLEPQLRYGLRSFDSTLNKQTTHFMGIRAGLIYRF
ncbi:outer membrane beta-barrel protein [bacterium SCSIO 12741]|nr:outer membrane beta-barrel protein [bacterium SCSIO 12741]